MPRPLAFGNGEMLVQIDPRGRIRDLHWPMGEFDHLAGRSIRTGVWVDHQFSWCDESAWQIRPGYASDDPLVSWSEWWHPGFQLRLEVSERLEGPSLFARRFRVINEGPAREVRLFSTHAPHLREGDMGNCAFYHHPLGGIIHYKGPTVLLFAWDPAPDQYACGITGYGGLEGTWRDAEDGYLSMNAIAQGSVDSTQGVTLHLQAGESREATFWILASDSIERLTRPVHRGEWPNQAEAADRDYAAFARRSLAIMRTQIANSGAILAANDSDIMESNRANYSYCWPRDGAHVAEVFLDEGDASVAENYLDFALRLMREVHPNRPYFLQKYRADGTLGASWHPWFVGSQEWVPYQLDETASTLSLALRMPTLSPDHRRFLVERPLAFLLENQTPDGLPKPSYDLWEERRGIAVYTVATVIKALRDGGETEAAERMTAALLEKIWDPKSGGFHRRLTPDGHPDPTPDASSLYVGTLGILPIDHPAVRRNADWIERHLWMHSPRAGLARYPGDYYFRKSEKYPGNPWIICTLWLAQHRLMEGQFARAQWILDWVMAHASPTGVLSEQLHPETGEPLSVSPLTWSHAEFVKTWRQWQRLQAS